MYAFTYTCFDGIPAEMGLSFSKDEFMTLAKILLYLSSCHFFVTLQIQHSVGHDNFPWESTMPPSQEKGVHHNARIMTLIPSLVLSH